MYINDLIQKSHKIAKDKGWWDEPKSFPEQIALMHSELSEALEDFRNNKYVYEVYYEDGKPCGIPTELADCVIRILDTCGYYGVDLQKAILEKIAYNETRPYKHGNKKI